MRSPLASAANWHLPCSCHDVVTVLASEPRSRKKPWQLFRWAVWGEENPEMTDSRATQPLFAHHMWCSSFWEEWRADLQSTIADQWRLQITQVNPPIISPLIFVRLTAVVADSQSWRASSAVSGPSCLGFTKVSTISSAGWCEITALCALHCCWYSVATLLPCANGCCRSVPHWRTLCCGWLHRPFAAALCQCVCCRLITDHVWPLLTLCAVCTVCTKRRALTRSGSMACWPGIRHTDWTAETAV